MPDVHAARVEGEHALGQWKGRRKDSGTEARTVLVVHTAEKTLNTLTVVLVGLWGENLSRA